ncbi:beta-glucosidase [Paenibacillus algorifonticola]|uniref:Beta-glucosidase n=1 Tax=Paenibacillus algorifonticola TaxID=684063 RepID=A0A1I2ILN0_9BACL|nr:glycoside hydrolase family 3 N-terminal domain-containing protein [Paenibacillus algorifonticola]SFF41756.1 beta-glucosidase [Paenibacillus algorifonticola]
MKGVWHGHVKMGAASTLFIFTVEEWDGDYRLAVHSVPGIYSFEAGGLKAEGSKGNELKATGYLAMFGADMTAQLIFGETFLTGTVTLPFGGPFPLEGKKGQPSFRNESLVSKAAEVQGAAVVERTDAEIREQVEQLLGRMSVEEKIGQMSQVGASNFSFGGDVESEPVEVLIAKGKIGSILGAFDMNQVLELQRIAVEQSPLRIPLLFNADVIHGFQTIFPVPLAWSCSWDMEAIRKACAIAAKEAAASGITYNHAPMVDVTRDARWGRVVEGAGEDPYLGAAIAKAQVEGFQGESLLDPDTLIACLKHFIAYGAAEAGRDYNTVDISERTLRDVFLPPFRAGIEAGAGSVMNAFNLYDGIPIAGNTRILRDLLREELGFEGMLISDYAAIDELVIHGAAEGGKEAAAQALHATMDIEMVTRLYEGHLPALLAEGKVAEEQLNAAVRRILTYKFKIGIMDAPYRYVRPEEAYEHYLSPEHLEASRVVARKSIVLLKNNGVLPLAPSRKLAVIGPFAASRDLLGPWQFSNYASETATLLQGLAAKGFTPKQLLYAEGCGVHEPLAGGIERAVEQALQADMVLLALGESSDMSGEAASRMDVTLPEAQLELAKAIAQTGKPVVLILTNGRPLVLEWFENHMSAIVESWFLGSQAGHALADVLLGDYNPSGKLTMSFPYKVGQVPVYYNHYRTGRPLTESNSSQKFISKYIDGPNEPLYPFGYGLSYTTFAYSELALSRAELRTGDTLEVAITVTNTGSRAGEEIVQLYIQDVHGSVVRPVKELKGFQKLLLEAGESRKAVFTLSEEHLKFTTASMRHEVEAGQFKVYVGGSSRETLTAEFEWLA